MLDRSHTVKNIRYVCIGWLGMLCLSSKDIKLFNFNKIKADLDEYVFRFHVKFIGRFIIKKELNEILKRTFNKLVIVF